MKCSGGGLLNFKDFHVDAALKSGVAGGNPAARSRFSSEKLGGGVVASAAARPFSYAQ
jgi:hypothetical protein